MDLDLGPDRDRGRDLEQLPNIATGEVGHRPQDPLTPEKLIREGRNVAHVDSGADDDAAWANRPQRGRNQLAYGREDDRRVQRLGAGCVRRSRPLGTHRESELGRRLVAGPDEGEDALSAVAGDLHHDMGGGAETIKSEAQPFSGQAQAAVADRASTEERRHLEIVPAGRQLKAEARVGDHPLGVSAIELVPREAGVGAEVLLAPTAVLTGVVDPAEPGHAHSHTDLDRLHSVAYGVDDPYDLVTGYQGQLWIGELTVDNVKVGPADGAGIDGDSHLTGARLGDGQLDRSQRPLRLLENHRAHRPIVSRRLCSAAMGWRRILPYLAGASGVALITAGIGVAGHWVDTPTVAVAYVVLVIYLGARTGRLPALATALLSFAVYDFFFVPPYRSLAISAPRNAISLLVLLAAAAISERVVSALVVRTTGAEAKARESQSLYEVALTALRESEPVAALEVLCRRASLEPGISSMTVLTEAEGGKLEPIAGDPTFPGELSQAAWSVAHETSQGLRIEIDRLEVFQQFPPQPAYLRLPGGVAVIRTDGAGPSIEGSRMLAALVAMAGLLLDRRRGNLESARARALEESDRLKANVLSALAHEVKTPLASLRAGLSAMSLDRRLSDDQRRLLGGLESETARLDRIVHNVLTMTRLDEGLTGERSPVDLAEVVGSSISSLERLLEPYQLAVRVPEDLPPVLGNEVQLDRVFANLLENAAHWTIAGGQIQVGARTGHGVVEAWVQNEGPEIPAATLSDIFASYWTGRAKGSGLGLAICRRIVETHGGTIAVRNLRTGPRFTVRLPVAEPVGVQA